MSIDDVLAELKKNYLKALPERISQIESFWKQGDSVRTETEFHKLKGTGKTYGLPDVSTIGALGEKVCKLGDRSAEVGVPLALKSLRFVCQNLTTQPSKPIENSEDFLALKKIAG